MSCCGSLWGHLVWKSLCFLYLDICFLPKILAVFTHNFIKYTFYPFLFIFFCKGYNANIRYPRYCPKDPWNCFYFLILVTSEGFMIIWYTHHTNFDLSGTHPFSVKLVYAFANNKRSEREIKESIPFNHRIKKKKIPGNKST